MNSARAFLSGVIDYAGLFPPAHLSMTDAVLAYSRHAAGDDRDLLGRFVVSAGRLDELGEVLDAAPVDSSEWRLSVIAGDDLPASVSDARRFNERRAGRHKALCDTIEVTATTADAVGAAAALSPEFTVFVEVPTALDPRETLTAIRAAGLCAKIRTGGVVESAIPDARDVLRFVSTCVELGVPFKATAGLHHFIRGDYPLTYAPGSPTATMFGYMNVLLASAFMCGGMGNQAARILTATDPLAIAFDSNGVTWHGQMVDWSTLASVREHVVLSFGSCSFEEPVAEAKALHFID